MFNLSVVNVIPDAHKDAINQIAEIYRCGENNLSVKLVDNSGSIFGVVILGGSLKIMHCSLMMNLDNK